ncbi:hypothetical protein MMC28_000813 [Mycoblastus sanguinarius]|nr:hypothetical protein [Mycoblastus sanguinarius]
MYDSTTQASYFQDMSLDNDNKCWNEHEEDSDMGSTDRVFPTQSITQISAESPPTKSQQQEPSSSSEDSTSPHANTDQPLPNTFDMAQTSGTATSNLRSSASDSTMINDKPSAEIQINLADNESSLTKAELKKKVADLEEEISRLKAEAKLRADELSSTEAKLEMAVTDLKDKLRELEILADPERQAMKHDLLREELAASQERNRDLQVEVKSLAFKHAKLQSELEPLRSRYLAKQRENMLLNEKYLRASEESAKYLAVLNAVAEDSKRMSQAIETVKERRASEELPADGCTLAVTPKPLEPKALSGALPAVPPFPINFFRPPSISPGSTPGIGGGLFSFSAPSTSQPHSSIFGSKRKFGEKEKGAKLQQPHNTVVTSGTGPGPKKRAKKDDSDSTEG